MVTVTNLHANNELVTILEGQIRDILSREMRNAPNPVFKFDDEVLSNILKLFYFKNYEILQSAGLCDSGNEGQVQL